MAADSDYSEILERLADSHQERLAGALKTLEDDVASLMATAPTKDGKLFDLEWAVSARPQIRAALEADYLSEVDAAIRDYTKVSADASKMLSSYGDFTKLDQTVISQLQRLSFQGFEAIANEYLDVMANEVYQSTLTGRSFNDTVKNLRQTINGVYIESDNLEANRLVDVAANGTAAQQADAVRQLQTVYARDRVGNNLRRYATQMAQDSLMQFDASINTAIGKQSGATKWKYYGGTVRDSRPFCVEHAGQVFTDEEIEETWSGSWKGKASGDPFIVRGGYNCRHHWRPVFDAEADDIEAKEKNKPKSGNFVLNDEIEVFGSNSDAKAFEGAMSALSPVQLAAVNKLAKPRKVIASEGARGQYNAFDRSVSADPAQRGGSVVRHEYGHHVDYTMGNIYQPFSVTDTAFITAFDKQRKALNFHKSKEKFSSMAEVRDELYNVETVTVGSRMVGRLVIKNDELGNYSDVFDALSAGAFQKNFGGYGHGGAYFKKKDARLKEVFANLFALYGSPEWPRVKKLTPILADEFEVIMGKI